MADRTRALSFSSDQTVVKRWFGGEILDHSPESVRMDFLNSGRAPLLQFHDHQAVIGVIETASIHNGIGVANVRFGRTGTASDALQNVDDGIAVNTSVGYHVHAMRLDSEVNGEPVYRIVDWEPLEISQVAVPADPFVGFGRANITGTQPRVPATIDRVEQARCAAIRSLCKAARIDAGVEQRWIDEGAEISDTIDSNGKRIPGVAAEIVEVTKSRYRT